MPIAINLSKKTLILPYLAVLLLLISGTTHAQTCPEDISHYWKLDETGTPTDFYDTFAEINNAFCSSGACPSPATGIINGAQYFDGIGDEVNVLDDDTFDWGANDSFSIEFWMRRDTACSGSENEVMIGRFDPMFWYIGIACAEGGKVTFELADSDGGGDGAGLLGSTVVTNGAWYHIVAVRDAGAGTISIYVNGTEEDSVPASFSSGFAGDVDVNIGYLNFGDGFHYEGMLDEVAFYNRALSETEIKSHYYLAKGYCNLCDIPIAIMPLGDSITEGSSSGADPDDEDHWVSYRKDLWDTLTAGGYEVDFVGSLSNGASLMDDPDHEGQPARSDEWIADNVYDFLVANPANVVLLHIGTNELDSSELDVADILDEIDRYETDSGTAVTVILAGIINRLCCMDSPPCIACETTTDFNNNVEAMAQIRIDNGDKIILVDMENDAGIDYRQYPDGDMWDFLHPYEIGYAKMAALWYDALTTFMPVCGEPTLVPPEITSSPATEAIVNRLYTYDVAATGYPEPTYSLNIHPDGMVINETTGLIEWTPTVDQAGPNPVEVVATNDEGTDTQNFTIQVASCPGEMSHYWKLNETDSPSSYLDYVGTNDATCSNCPTPTAGMVDGAQYFDGSGDEVNVSDDGTFDWGADDSFSIEFWMRKGSACSGSDNEVMIGRRDPIFWYIGIACAEGGKVTFELADSDGGGDGVGLLGSTVVTDGAWYHIAAVRDFDAGTVSIYVNGTEEDWAPASFSSDFGSSKDLNVGYLNFYGGFHYNGTLDEVALWNKVLTIDEIGAHYDAGRLNGYGYCAGTTECQVDEDCDDGIFCNGDETCDENNVCQPGTPPDCDDGVDCTDDTCDPATDSCLNNPNDGLCDNGYWCDGTEICDPVLGCQEGIPVDCNDGLFCNGEESCDEDTDQCVLGEEPCAYCYPDGCFCNEETDECKYDNGDTDGDGVYDDEDSCPNSDLEATITIGKCDTGVHNYLFQNGCTMKDLINDCVDQAIDSCPECPDDMDWDDDIFCDDGEFCIAGICLPGIEFCLDDDDCIYTNNHGKFVICVVRLAIKWMKMRLINLSGVGAIIKCAAQFDIPSTSSTTTTSLIPPPPQCESDLDCDDGLYCNGYEICDDNKCQAGSNPCPDDGLFCNGAESCDDETDTCVFPGNPCEPDLICDEEINSCIECLEDADCDDGLFCNGEELCIAGICLPGLEEPCPDDDLFCNGVESCDDEMDTCVFPGNPCEPNLICVEAIDSCVGCLGHADCDDDLFCNGAETCVEGICQPGNNPCPEGAVCNEETNSCESTTTTSVSPGPGPGPLPPTTTTTSTTECENNEDCDDEEFCNGKETCVDGVCQAGIESCPDDGLFCNGVESCDEDNDICIQSGKPCQEWETCDELTDVCLSELPSPTIELIPDSAWYSQTIPVPLFILIIGQDTHFNQTTSVAFDNNIIWPPMHWVLSPTNILVFSIIKPISNGTIPEVKLTVSTETSSGFIEQITESLNLRQLSWIKKN